MTRNPIQFVAKIAEPCPASMLQMGLAERTAVHCSIAGAQLGRYAPDSVFLIPVADYRGAMEVAREIETGMSSTAAFAKYSIL